MKNLRNWPALAATTAMIAVAMVWGDQAQTANAQGNQPNGMRADLSAFTACSTTDYSDVTAKALGITTVELRKDIVGGQSVQAIATAKNVDFKTVSDAIQVARKADIDQAVKDGILTQDQATAMEAGGGQPGGRSGGGQPNGQPNGQPDAAGTPPAPGSKGGNGGTNGRGGPQGPQGGPQNQQDQLPDISTMARMAGSQAKSEGTPPATGNNPRTRGGAGGFGGGPGGVTFNMVKPYAVVAQVVNLKCADLMKAVTTAPGKSIAAVAADQKVEVQTVTAALTKAYQEMLAKNVADGVITQAQSAQFGGNLDKAVAAFINNARTMQPGARPTQAK